MLRNRYRGSAREVLIGYAKRGVVNNYYSASQSPWGAGGALEGIPEPYN